MCSWHGSKVSITQHLTKVTLHFISMTKTSSSLYKTKCYTHTRILYICLSLCAFFADWPEWPLKHWKGSTAAFLQTLQSKTELQAKAHLSATQTDTSSFKWQHDASARHSVHQSAMAINHRWSLPVCRGHLDRHCTGCEIFSRGTIRLDWVHRDVYSDRATGYSDLQLCLVLGWLEWPSLKPWRKKRNIRHVKTWACCPACIWIWHLYQVCH